MRAILYDFINDWSRWLKSRLFGKDTRGSIMCHNTWRMNPFSLLLLSFFFSLFFKNRNKITKKIGYIKTIFWRREIVAAESTTEFYLRRQFCFNLFSFTWFFILNPVVAMLFLLLATHTKLPRSHIIFLLSCRDTFLT